MIPKRTGLAESTSSETNCQLTVNDPGLRFPAALPNFMNIKSLENRIEGNNRTSFSKLNLLHWLLHWMLNVSYRMCLF